jgi:hypothetical protein
MDNSIKYLENEICEFEPLKPIDYSIKKNIISTSLFRMKSGGYKNFDKYLNGIKTLSSVAKEKNIEVRIFIDQTIKNDKKIMDYLFSFDNITPIYFKCSDFFINDHHVGLFGTMVRFFPLFKFPNNDAKVVFLADADTKTEYISRLIFLYEELKKNKVLKKVFFSYNGRFFHVNISSDKIVNLAEDKKNDEFFLPYCIAQKFFGVKRISKKPFIKFMKKIQLYMNDNTRPSKILSDYYISPSTYKIKCENNICFGIDEYFINRILFRYFLKKKIPICYNNLYDVAQFYFFKHPQNINENLINLPKNEYVDLFNEYMKKIDLNNYSFQEIDSQIFTHEESEENKITPFMDFYGKKMISLLEEIDKNKDYRIYAQSQIYSMKMVDYKKLFKIRYIRFVNLDHKDIIFNQINYIE